MKFRINVGQFLKSLNPVFDIATKNISKDWKHSNFVTLKAFQDKVVAISHGGTASIVAEISDKNWSNLNYTCIEDGISTCSAIDLNLFLNTLPSIQDIIVEATPNDLYITVVTDKKKKNRLTIPVIAEDVCPPVMSTQFNKFVKVNREVFSQGLARLLFAPGTEIAKPHYKCFLFETVSSKKLRFAAGTGARFAVDEIEGDNIITELDRGALVSFIFPDLNIPNLSRIVPILTQSDISIKQAVASKDSQEQIVIECEGITIFILGLDSAIKFVEVQKVLGFDYKTRISTNISEWKIAAAQVEATLKTSDKSDNSYKNADLITNLEEKCFEVVSVTRTKTEIYPEFTEVLRNDGGTDISVYCSSEYIVEMVRNSSASSGDIQIWLEDKVKPIVIKYPENPNKSNGTVENFYMFFATLKKPE